MKYAGLTLTLMLSSVTAFALAAEGDNSGLNSQPSESSVVNTPVVANNETENSHPAESTQLTAPNYKPSKSQLDGVKKLAETIADLTAKKNDEANPNKSQAEKDLTTLISKLEQTPSVKSLYDYFTSLSEKEQHAYYLANTTSDGGKFGSSLEVNGKKVSGQGLYDLRSKKTDYDLAKEKQKASQDQLQAQITDSVKLFDEVAALFNEGSKVSYTSIDETARTAFKTSVDNLKSKVAELSYSTLVNSAASDINEAETTAVYSLLTASAPETTPAPGAITAPDPKEPADSAPVTDKDTDIDNAPPTGGNKAEENKEDVNPPEDNKVPSDDPNVLGNDSNVEDGNKDKAKVDENADKVSTDTEVEEGKEKEKNKEIESAEKSKEEAGNNSLETDSSSDQDESSTELNKNKSEEPGEMNSPRFFGQNYLFANLTPMI